MISDTGRRAVDRAYQYKSASQTKSVGRTMLPPSVRLLLKTTDGEPMARRPSWVHDQGSVVVPHSFLA